MISRCAADTVYASVVIDADSHQRVDVLPDRKSDTLAEWLREHPGVVIVVRDGSTTYAEAVRRVVPAARQVSDRRHLWHGLSLDTVKRYAPCARTTTATPPPQYRACLVDDYREHLRARRAAEPSVPVQRLYAEIRARGYTGGLNLLYKHINRGRLNGDRDAVAFFALGQDLEEANIKPGRLACRCSDLVCGA